MFCTSGGIFDCVVVVVVVVVFVCGIVTVGLSEVFIVVFYFI